MEHNLGISGSLVKRCDHIPHSEVFRYLQKSDYFLFMSCYKRGRPPNVVKEAMLAKTKDIEELISDREDGFFSRLSRY